MPPDDSLSIDDMRQEQIAERLEEIERCYDDFFQEAKDGFYISTREGQFLDCNDTLVNMLEYRCTEELLTIDLNYDLWVHLEDRQKFQSIIEDQGFVRDYEALFKRKNGDPIYVSLSSHVWRDSRGKIRGYRGFVVDRTKEKLMRDRLALSETKYRRLFENIKDGLFISDARGAVIDCNQALLDIIGFTKEEFLRMDYYKKLFVDHEQVTHFRRKMTREGMVRDYELKIVRKDGAVRDVSMSGYMGRDNSGEVINYHGMMKDITEQRRLQRQLVSSERLSAMGKMASQLAHELNNPIYGIMNCLELIKDAVPPTHPRRKYVDLAHNESRRTSMLLLKMLKFFKPDDEKRVMTDLNKLLEETLLFYEKQFKNLNIKVVTELDKNLPEIMAVESQLKQVFINMVINANAAMPSGGELRVNSSHIEANDRVIVTLGDTGMGIPPENLDRIFEAFFTTKKEARGVGLGLSVCYGFIKDHGGTINVESEVGKGTTFTIELPVSEIGDRSNVERTQPNIPTKAGAAGDR